MTIILPQPNGKPRPPATVLQGPADADAFRRSVGRYKDRWYCDPLPACDLAEATDAVWPSVSTVKKAEPFGGAEYVAMKRIVADGRPLPKDPDEAYDHMKSVNSRGLKAAGNRGTHVHKMAEELLYFGEVRTPNGPGAEYRGALEDFFAAHQPKLFAAEIVCINRTLNGVGYGGTGDGLVWINGRLYKIDWKSRDAASKHDAYPDECAQIAAYTLADYAIVAEGGEARRIPMPAVDGGLVLSVRPDGVQPYEIDLGKSAERWLALHAWWCGKRIDGDLVTRQWPIKRAPVRTDVPPGVVATSRPKPAMPDEGGTVRDVDVKALRDAFMSQAPERLAAIVAVTKEAAAEGLPCSVTQSPTIRRFELARGLMCWAAYTGGEDEGHELLRTLARIATADAACEQPGVPIGQAVGAMDWRQATAFADAASLLRDGGALGFDPAGTPAVMPPKAA